MLNLLGRELEISIGELEFRFGVGNQPAMGVQKGRQCLELHFLIFEYTFPPRPSPSLLFAAYLCASPPEKRLPPILYLSGHTSSLGRSSESR